MNSIYCLGGWQKLYQPLLDLAALYHIKVLQVKEKLGGLRFYIQPTDLTTTAEVQQMVAIISAAEAASRYTCEKCGEDDPNVVSTRPLEGRFWTKTFCQRCREEMKQSHGA